MRRTCGQRRQTQLPPGSDDRPPSPKPGHGCRHHQQAVRPWRCYPGYMSEPATQPEESVLRIKFAGGRFDLGALPSSTLVEITRLSRIFVAMAEDEWRKDYPSRKRVPAGFAKRLELSLKDVREGSTQPVLLTRDEIDVDEQVLGLQIEHDLVQRAARRTEDAFISITTGHDLPADFPDKALHDIQMVFSSFDVAEYPRFWDASGAQYDYTQSARKEFLSAQSGDLSITNGRVSGRLFEINTNERRAEIELIGGNSVPVRFGPPLSEDMKEAVSVGQDGRHVALDGSYVTQDGRISEVFDVTAVFAVSLPRNEAGKRLAELLGDDPLGEVGAINPEAAEAAGEILRTIQIAVGAPAIFPGEEGSVQLVWMIGTKRATIEVLGADAIIGRVFDRADRSRKSYEWGSIDELHSTLQEFLGVQP